jgi:peptidoglycan hydrolase CwlO-like protein
MNDTTTNTAAAKKSYTFKTIVAPEAVRAEFTTLRDSLNSSDKELMQAFWNLGNDQLDALKAEVANLQKAAHLERENKKEIKAAAKKKDEGDKPVAKRGRKPKAEKEPVAKREKKAKTAPVTNTNEKVNEVQADDGEEPITVVIGV